MENNTKLFHKSLIQCCHHNHVVSLQSDQVEKLTSHDDITSELNNYFNNSSIDHVLDRSQSIEDIFQNIPSLITPTQNYNLMHLVSLEEVTDVFQNMPKDKSPDPYGFTTQFFHHCWYLIKRNV